MKVVVNLRKNKMTKDDIELFLSKNGWKPVPYKPKECKWVHPTLAIESLTFVQAGLKAGINPFACLDCNCDTRKDEYYVLKDEVWKATGGGRHLLCIGCAEARLGRRLVREDFSDASVNFDPSRKRSIRLKDRLGEV